MDMGKFCSKTNLANRCSSGHGLGCIGAAKSLSFAQLSTLAASHEDQQSAGDDNDPHHCDPKQAGVALHDLSLDEQADVDLTCRYR